MKPVPGTLIEVIVTSLCTKSGGKGGDGELPSFTTKAFHHIYLSFHSGYWFFVSGAECQTATNWGTSLWIHKANLRCWSYFSIRKSFFKKFSLWKRKTWVFLLGSRVQVHAKNPVEFDMRLGPLLPVMMALLILYNFLLIMFMLNKDASVLAPTICRKSYGIISNTSLDTHYSRTSTTLSYDALVN